MSDVNVSGSGNTSTPAASPSAPPAPAAPTPAAPAQAQATPSAPQGSATEPPATTPQGQVPSWRLREQRDSLNREWEGKLTQERQALQAEANRWKQQVQALVGVTPPQNPEQDEIKRQFFKVFPWAQKLEERFGDLEHVMERAGDFETQSNHYWTSYGRQTMDRLFDVAEKSLGTPLTEEGKRQLHSSFTGFVQSSPELIQRYANDPTIVEDYWKSFTASFVDPVRRNSTATVAGRAAQVATLPQDTPGGMVRPGATQAQPKDLDERVAMGFARFQQLTGKS